jgi:hypothetical protein
MKPPQPTVSCGVASSWRYRLCCMRSLEEPSSKDSGFGVVPLFMRRCQWWDTRVLIKIHKLMSNLYAFASSVDSEARATNGNAFMPQMLGVSGASQNSPIRGSIAHIFTSRAWSSFLLFWQQQQASHYSCTVLENMRTTRQNACCQPRKARRFAKERRWHQKCRFLESCHDLI